MEGDGANPVMTMGLMMIYIQAIICFKGADIIATMLKALKKSEATIIGEIEEIKEIGSSTKLTISLGTVELVLSISFNGYAAVDITAKVLNCPVIKQE